MTPREFDERFNRGVPTTVSAALGIATYNRPEHLAKCLRSVASHVPPSCPVFVFNDGSDRLHHAEYARAYKRLQASVIMDESINRGVTVAKNSLLCAMMDRTDAEWLFICEDDVLVKSPQAITGYIAACEASGLAHLSFGHHQAWNPAPTSVGEYLTLWPNAVAGWSIFSRTCLENVGLMDEAFDKNCLEHVEHTMRLARAGYAFRPVPGALMADATGSHDWLSEVPGSFKKSTISNDPLHQLRFNATREMWKAKDPVTFAMVWP